MNEIEEIADELARIYDGEAWHGLSLTEALTGVSAARATAQPIVGAHGIWEIVAHIAGWNRVWAARLRGNAMESPPEGDFPAAKFISEESWQSALKELAASQRELLAAVIALTPDKLTSIVPGRDFTVGFMLRGIVRHIVYHTGQIVVLAKNNLV